MLVSFGRWLDSCDGYCRNNSDGRAFIWEAEIINVKVLNVSIWLSICRFIYLYSASIQITVRYSNIIVNIMIINYFFGEAFGIGRGVAQLIWNARSYWLIDFGGEARKSESGDNSKTPQYVHSVMPMAEYFILWYFNAGAVLAF